MAVWALSRLAPTRHAALRKSCIAAEEDAAVRGEWLEVAA
jgi:hypothetical protein